MEDFFNIFQSKKRKKKKTPISLTIIQPTIVSLASTI